jgi:hypothetical protein
MATALEADNWHFDAIVEDDSLIKCPSCKEVSPLSLWSVNEDGMLCELCGSHMTLDCPKCYVGFDSVKGPTFEVYAPF